MKTLYLECAMGAAGDMLAAALYELCTPAQRQAFLAGMAPLAAQGVTVRPEPAETCGVRGTHMTVLVHGEEEAADGGHRH